MTDATGVPTYILERQFDAPRELVWRAWTEPDLLSRWYGPNVETTTHGLDLEVGGRWLVEMKWGGNSQYQRADYTEIAAPERLVWLHSSTDAEWNVISNPMMPDWPRVLRTTVTFDEADGRTLVRLVWEPHEATDAELAAFAGAIEGMGRGWGAGMEILAEMLAELQS